MTLLRSPRCTWAAVALVMAACASPSPDPNAPMRGALSAFQIGGNATGAASFFDATELDARLDCDETIFGACRVETCVRLGDDPLPTPEPISAGAVTIRGQGECTIAADESECRTDQPFWDLPTGGTVTFSAPGDALPAFSLDLAAPRSPLLDAPTATAVSRSTDVDVEWTGGTGTLRVYAGGWTADNAERVLLTCDAPASAGAMVVPEAALEALPLGLPLVIVVRTSAVEDIGGYATELAASSLVTQVSITP